MNTIPTFDSVTYTYLIHDSDSKKSIYKIKLSCYSHSSLKIHWTLINIQDDSSISGEKVYKSFDTKTIIDEFNKIAVNLAAIVNI